MSSAKARSARSFSVSADIGSTAFGTLTPLRSDSVAADQAHRSRRNRRRSSRPGAAPCRRRAASSVPGSSAAKISGCGSGARFASPGLAVEIEAEAVAGGELDRPSAKVPRRSFGPCRSARMPIGRPVAFSISRIASKRRAMVVMRAVAEIEAEHVDAGVEQGADLSRASSSPGRGSRRSWRCAGAASASPQARLRR